jgi:CubicO group peptidase (beta-lactamase class C family)
MKNSVLIFFAFCLLQAGIPANGQTATITQNKFKSENGKYISFSEMDGFLKYQMDSIGIPGLSIAIINGERIVYYQVKGVTNVETKEKVLPETLFDAGSMSKTPFTYLVMRMVEQGILNLDQPLYTYLPYPDIEYDSLYKLITARMVLSHTSGFPNWRRMNKDKRLDIKFTPGTQFLYSGEGFEYLALVVAHLKNIHKNDLQDLFMKEVSEPLRMKNAFYTWNDYVASHQASGHVDGKVADGWGINAEKPDFYSSYSLQSEAKSYSNFIIALMNEKGLKKSTYDEMLKVQFPATTNSENSKRGLGIVIEPSEFGPNYSHGGYNLNFSSEFMFNKEQKFGYVFFTNCNKGSDFNKKLLEFLRQ